MKGLMVIKLMNPIYKVEEVLKWLNKQEQTFSLQDESKSKRGNSWNLCYTEFKTYYKKENLNCKEKDLLAKSLAVYLAECIEDLRFS